MKTVLFYYNEFSNFEVACTAFQFHESLVTAAMEDRVYTSEENMRFVPHTTIAALDPKEVKLFIIPGGNPAYLFENKDLREFLTVVNQNGGKIAAICGGPSLLAYYGLLEGRKYTGGGSGIDPSWDEYNLFDPKQIRDEKVVADGNIITATGQSFVELSLELNVVMGMYKNDQERKNDIKWWLGNR